VILHLGVDDVPYADEVLTTGDVAQFLETKYGVMSVFAEQNVQFIADRLADAVTKSINSLLAGAPLDIDPFGAAPSQIEQRFREYITHEEITQSGVTGVPTEAALLGKSKRFKRQSGARRPSFIDSGMYESHFRTWITDNA
jgi:hypothetical protein